MGYDEATNPASHSPGRNLGVGVKEYKVSPLAYLGTIAVF